ncbi:MAG: MBOAT family protein [Candidatus Krumholzibacteria bacterium]|nr:MBOAT family protein [Candidatus Krumholzibacteria bacterium]
MLFTSYKYALFAGIAFCVYYLATRLSRGRSVQNLALLGLSYLFYAFWDWRWCLLLLGVTATGFMAGILLTRSRVNRRWILVLALLTNLGALGAFKYFGFFAGSFASLMRGFGLHADWATLNLVLPVGLSYYVFQNLSYVIDVYRRDTIPTTGAVEYATALSFFPQLLAGPITRPRDLLPQLLERRTFDDDRARDGLRQILWGLTKKMLVADSIGSQVNHVWANVGQVDGLTLAISAVLYSFQIYCDFSGYADIAIGTAKIFNLRLSGNFDYPYFSTSVRSFWRRWHITLAGWMRDYLYIPLGGSRTGAFRGVLNLLITFLVVGLWHGANWTFVVWGLLHGSFLAIERIFRRGDPKTDGKERGAWMSILDAAIVFALVTFAWVFFRAPSLEAAIAYLGRGLRVPFDAVEHARYVPVLALSAGLLVYERFMRRREHGLSISGLPPAARWAVYLAICMALLLFGHLGGREGIYVQF